MKLTKREKWALWEMLNFPIHRYLMCCSMGREDGSERADMHLKMSEILAKFVLCTHLDDFHVGDEKFAIHDFLADILTDRMDEVIAFPIDRPVESGHEEYGILANKFFDVIIQNMNGIKKVVNDNPSNTSLSKR